MNIILTLGLALILSAAGDPKTISVKPKKEANGAAAAKAADPAREEYEKLIAKDEGAMESIETLVKEFEAFEAKGAPGSKAALAAKADQILEGVQKDYEEFLVRYPKHVEARLAYGSFLNEIGSEAEAIVQWEKAREIDPNNPTSWNNLANIYGHIGPVKKAFQYYEKAIELDPKEPVYIQNLATTVYLFRKDAVETYRIDEKQVFDKALELYQRAMKLDPTNLVLATDIAQSYYGIKPTRLEDALAAWNHALKLAKRPVEKEGIYMHLARVEMHNGLLKEAEAHLELVKDPGLETMRNRLQRNLKEIREGNRSPSSESEEKQPR